MRHTAEILTIGDEILKGTVINTNGAFLGEALSGLGFRVVCQRACPDDERAIAEHISDAIARADLVVITGGLGPTPDDVTRQSIAGFFKVPLIFSREQFALIRGFYSRRGKRVPPLVKLEAMFPRNADPLVNKHGIALGFSIPCGEKLMVVLPGVPSEMKKMFAELVEPLLRKRYPGLRARHNLIVKIAGVSEPRIMERLGMHFFSEEFDFGIYPHGGDVTIRLQASSRAVIGRLKKHISRVLKKDIYAFEETTLAASVGALLTRRKLTLAVAESCTGGLLAGRITSVPGSSRYFRGAVVAYGNDIKQSMAGVDAETLKKKGAVSAETAKALAEGVRSRFGSNYGIGITGIAGPKGGSVKKPVGTVYIALASPAGRPKVWHHEFWGDRIQVQERAVKRALELLWRTLTATKRGQSP